MARRREGSGERGKVPERTGWPVALTMMWMETASGAGYERMGPKERGALSRPSVAVTSEEPSAKVTFTAACQATELAKWRVGYGGTEERSVGSRRCPARRRVIKIIF